MYADMITALKDNASAAIMRERFGVEWNKLIQACKAKHGTATRSNLIKCAEDMVSATKTKGNENFNATDIKQLEIMDLEDAKQRALELITTNSYRPMQPDKIRWFKNKIWQKKSVMDLVKMMYDMLLSGEGNSVIGTKNSMQKNSYRMKFGEDEVSNPTDTVTMDIPLLLRIMEYAREDAKEDVDLHRVVENMLVLSEPGETLSMDDYENIVGNNGGEDEQVLPEAKPKTPDSIKAAKKVAAGYTRENFGNWTVEFSNEPVKNKLTNNQELYLAKLTHKRKTNIVVFGTGTTQGAARDDAFEKARENVGERSSNPDDYKSFVIDVNVDFTNYEYDYGSGGYFRVDNIQGTPHLVLASPKYYQAFGNELGELGFKKAGRRNIGNNKSTPTDLFAFTLTPAQVKAAGLIPNMRYTVKKTEQDNEGNTIFALQQDSVTLGKHDKYRMGVPGITVAGIAKTNEGIENWNMSVTSIPRSEPFKLKKIVVTSKHGKTYTFGSEQEAKQHFGSNWDSKINNPEWREANGWKLDMNNTKPEIPLGENDKIKGKDGKACWKGYRYNGTENGKDSCVKVNQ